MTILIWTMKTGRNALSIDYVHYDSDVDALRISTDSDGATSSSLLNNSDIVIDLASEDGLDVVGLGVLCASAYLPLGKKGYNAENDTLLLGEMTDEPEMVAENGDLIAYWQIDEDDRDGWHNPIGVAIKHASAHLAEVVTMPSGINVRGGDD